MTIGFILNGEDVVIQSGADRRLVDILRDDFHLLATRAGCRLGRCGACSVIFNGKVVASCLIPAFRVRGGEVITLEAFAQTNEYQDIALGFAREGVETCGYCDAAKYFAAEALLSKELEPDRQHILAAFEGVLCRCTDSAALVAGVSSAARIRQNRLYGRSV